MIKGSNVPVGTRVCYRYLRTIRDRDYQTFYRIVQEFIRSYTLYRINQRWNGI